MIDPFTLSTSAAGFISLALQVTELLHEYVSSVASAKKEAEALITETEALRVVLDKFVEFLRGEDANGLVFKDTSGICCVIAICRDQLQLLYRKLAKVVGIGRDTKTPSTSQYMARLTWPFQAKEISQYVQTLSRCRDILHFSLTIDSCTLMSKSNDEIMVALRIQQDTLTQVSKMMPLIPIEMSRLSNQIATVLHFMPTMADASANLNSILIGVQSLQVESKLKILQWLSPLEPPKRHQDVRSIRVEGTGKWLLQDPTFQNWRNYTDSNNRHALCCYGIPGAGKTVLMSLVIDYLLEQQAGDNATRKKAMVAYIYCDYRDQSLQTPANLLGGYAAVVKLLLAANGVNPNSHDRLGLTPLSWAAVRGHEAIARLLLATEGVDPDAKEPYYGRTPLSWAAVKGHEGVVRLLLAVEGVDPDVKTKHRRTPLSRAAKNGHEAVVKLLLAVDGVDPNSKDEYGMTPLALASRNGHEAVIKLLLAADNLDTSVKDHYGRRRAALAALAVLDG